MKPAPEEIAALAKEVAEAEATLQKLEWEIEEIGHPRIVNRGAARLEE